MHLLKYNKGDKIMKTKNFTIINMINTLNSFAEKKLPQKISYAITRNLMLLQKDYDCYSKSIEKLFEEHVKT